MIITYDAVPPRSCLLHGASPVGPEAKTLILALLTFGEGEQVTGPMMGEFLNVTVDEPVLLALRRLADDGLVALPDGYGLHEDDARLVLRIEPLHREPGAISVCWCPALSGGQQ